MNSGTIARNMYTLKKELGDELEWDDEDDETLSDAVGYAVQAHHCISCSVMAEPKYKDLARWAVISDYDINGGNNGVALPAYFGHMRVEKKQRHRGGHDQIYYDEVRKELDKLLEDLEGVDPCKSQQDRKDVLAALQGAENRIKSKLKTRKIWLYDWSEQLYKADYRDEGGTDMESKRRREGSKAAGLQWAAEFAGRQVKRRHQVIRNPEGKDKKVLLAKWYSAYAYPVPGGLTK